MKVSVIVPVYNVYKYLDKCLNSLVNQTLKDIEIIIVNDGSKENEEEIINKYLDKYSNIKYYKKENGGLSSARNYGISKSIGKFIGFVDSDDYVDINMYEKMYNAAESNEADIVVCNVENIYETYSQKINTRYFNTSVDSDYMLAAPMACNKLVKRELLQNQFLFKKNIWYEDLELIPTLVLETKKIVFLNDYYYKYLQRKGSIMNQQKFNDKILDIKIVLSSIESKFQEFNKLEKYSQELEYLHIEHLLYSTPLRICLYKEEGKRYLDEISNLFKEKYPNWKNNKYFKMKSIKFKVICYLTYLKKRNIINMLSKFK